MPTSKQNRKPLDNNAGRVGVIAVRMRMPLVRGTHGMAEERAIRALPSISNPSFTT